MTHNNIEKIYNKIDKHKKFWSRENTDLPIIGFWIGSYLPLSLYKGAESLKSKQKIEPEMVKYNDFIEDYKEFFKQDNLIDDDLIRVGQPFWGIPWIEAILDCNIKSSCETIWAEKIKEHKGEELINIKFDRDNSWLKSLVDFENGLVKEFGDKHPIGIASMRGPSDILSTFLSQQDFIFNLYDYSEKTSKILSNMTDFWIKTAKTQLNHIPLFLGGCGVGFWNLWSPGEALWFQEDAISILSPDLYKKYIFRLDEKISKSFEYTIMHLHPGALHSIESILDIKELRAIEVNIDINTDLKEVLPVLKEIMKTKSLLIWGLEKQSDIELVLNNLDFKGLMINITAPSIEKALKIKELIIN